MLSTNPVNFNHENVLDSKILYFSKSMLKNAISKEPFGYIVVAMVVVVDYMVVGGILFTDFSFVHFRT